MPKLTWNSPDDVVEYEIWRSLNSPNNFGNDPLSTITAKTYTDYMVRIHPDQGENNQTAYYKVRAILEQRDPPDALFPRVQTSYTNTLSTDYWILLRPGDAGGQMASLQLNPENTALLPNYPNPFNAGTTIPFRVQHAGEIDLTVYDILSRPVHTLYSGWTAAGEYVMRWDGRNSSGLSISTGTYFIILDANGRRAVRKVNLVK